MSSTLNQQMNTVFRNGLKIVNEYEHPILEEWKNIMIYLRKAGKKSEKNVRETIRFFSTYLFDPEIGEEDDIPSLINTSQPFQTNQFIITLLENAVHKVIQAEMKQNYESHQAVQYVFLTISEQILSQPYHDQFTIDAFLKHLVSSQQLPIEWAAVALRNDKEFVVEKWFNNASHDLLLGNDSMRADSIYALSEKLLFQMSKEQQKVHHVLPIPFDQGTLLICISQQDATQVIPFITYALEIFQKGKNTLKATKQEQQWKDSVIMFNENIMRSQSFIEATENITAGFVNYLPFERCALFSYSIHDQMSFGLFGHRLDNKAIQNITEDIANFPLIKSNLQKLELFGNRFDFMQPIYIKDAAAGFPSQYVQEFQLNSIVVAPIFTSSSNQLLGAVILDQGPGRYFTISEETFSALIKFGQGAGEILSRFMDEMNKRTMNQLHLSPREIDVLKLMAEGDSTIEAASALHLSEYTVRDYVSAIIQKMGARNRTEAVAKAIRDGMI